jgi:hypothetical protein
MVRYLFSTPLLTMKKHNPAAPGKGGIPTLLTFGCLRPALPEQHRAAASRIMKILSITTLVAAAVITGCTNESPQSASRGSQTTTNVLQGQVCPRGHHLRQVPMLVGIPSKEMLASLRRGEALLAGDVGNPDHPEIAQVCDTCQQWKTGTMAYWQPLPKDFGAEKKQ